MDLLGEGGGEEEFFIIKQKNIRDNVCQRENLYFTEKRGRVQLRIGLYMFLKL